MITAKDLRQMIFTMSLIKPECMEDYLEETANRFNELAMEERIEWMGLENSDYNIPVVIKNRPTGTRQSKNKPVVTSIAHVAVRGVRGRVLGEPTLK